MIVPVYKVEKYLKECIDSILNQTFTDFELILVDDGSPDRCPQMCDEAAKQDDRIQVIHQKNGGLSAARNTGIEAARGEWLGFVDSDDFVAPDFYEKLLTAAKEANADCAICSIQLTKEDGQCMDTPDNMKVEDCVHSGRAALETLMDKANTPYLVAWNKIYKREVFRTIRYPVGRLNEDNFIFAELFDHVETVSCVGGVRCISTVSVREASCAPNTPCGISMRCGDLWPATSISSLTGWMNCCFRPKNGYLRN